MKSWQFMRHGHEMLWFLRGSFSESELPLSYNAKVTNARAPAINWLRDQPFEQGMTIYAAFGEHPAAGGLYMFFYVFVALCKALWCLFIALGGLLAPLWNLGLPF